MIKKIRYINIIKSINTKPPWIIKTCTCSGSIYKTRRTYLSCKSSYNTCWCNFTDGMIILIRNKNIT